MAAYTDYNQIYRRMDSDPASKVYDMKSKFEGSKGKDLPPESRTPMPSRVDRSQHNYERQYSGYSDRALDRMSEYSDRGDRFSDRSSQYSDYSTSRRSDYGDRRSDYSDPIYSRFDSRTVMNNNNNQKYTGNGNYSKPYSVINDRNVIGNGNPRSKHDKPVNTPTHYRDNNTQNQRHSRAASESTASNQDSGHKKLSSKVSDLSQRFAKPSVSSDSADPPSIFQTNRDRFLSDSAVNKGAAERHSRGRTTGSTRQARAKSHGRTPRERERKYPDLDGSDENLSKVASRQRLFETLDVAQPVKKSLHLGRKTSTLGSDSRNSRVSPPEPEKFTDYSTRRAFLKPTKQDSITPSTTKGNSDFREGRSRLRNSSVDSDHSRSSADSDKNNLYGRQKLYTPLPVRRSADERRQVAEQKSSFGLPLRDRKSSIESDKSILSPTYERNSIASKQQLFETRIADFGKPNPRAALENTIEHTPQSKQTREAPPYRRAVSMEQPKNKYTNPTTKQEKEKPKSESAGEKNPYKQLPKRTYVRPTPTVEANPSDKRSASNGTTTNKLGKNARPTDFPSRNGRFIFESSSAPASRAMSEATSRTSSTVTTPCTPTLSTPEYEYENRSVPNPFKAGHIKRVGSKPPASIVANRTKMFEKNVDETCSVTEEADTYRQMKEMGTVFKPKAEPSTKVPAQSYQSSQVTPKPQENNSRSRTRNYSRPGDWTNGEKREAVKNSSSSKQDRQSNGRSNPSSTREQGDVSTSDSNETRFHKNSLYNSAPLDGKSAFENLKTKFSADQKVKPNFAGPGEVIRKSFEPPVVIVEGKGKNKVYPTIKPLPDSIRSPAFRPVTGPPKPPRTFEFSGEKLSPRSDGDGQESTEPQDHHGYEVHMKRPDSPSHAYTPLKLEKPDFPGPPDLPGPTRDIPATVQVTSVAIKPPEGTVKDKEHGSGGDDSVYSENAYDTLGGSSNHSGSHYDQYDTISLCHSEFDEDFRPPTLPRRPSYLRHRPLTTAFSSLDLRTSSADHPSVGKQLSTGMAPPAVIKESPTGISPTKTKGGFKLKYLLPRARRKADDLRKAQSVGCLLDEEIYQDVGYNNNRDAATSPVHLDQAGYAVPDIKAARKTASTKANELPQQKKPTDKIRAKLNQAFSGLRRAPPASNTPLSDGEEDEKPPDAEVLEERLKHCNSVKSRAIYASIDQIKQFLTKAYAQLYDYAVIVSLRKNPDSNLYEPYVKFTFPPQVDVEQTAVPQFCFPDAQLWHKVTEYKSEAFSFVLTDVTGTRQYGYCRRVLPPDLSNSPRMAEVLCIVSPLNAVKLYNQVLDEVEKRRCQSSIRAEEFLQAVYGRPMPSPGQSVTIRAMNVYEEAESLAFTRSADSRREGIDFECLLSFLSINKIIKIFASILLERKVIFIADKLSTLSACVHAFVSLIYPFSWQHTFIPLLPPNLIDVVCAPTPFIVGLLSANAPLLQTLDGEMEEVLMVDLDNHKLLQRFGDEKTILPKQLFRSLATALEMAKSESNLKNLMISEGFLRFFLETVGSFNQYMIKGADGNKQFQQEEFVCNAANAPSIMIFLQWFTETQMFEVYKTEKESEHGMVTGAYEERLLEWKSEDHDYSDNKKKKFKLFGKKGRK